MKRALMGMCLFVVACGGTGTTEITVAPAETTTTDSQATTTTAAAATTTVAGGSATTRNNPVPVGTAATVGDYEVTVVGFEPDATEAVLAHNMFNDEPADGFVYSLIRLSVVYNGDDTGQAWLDLNWKGIGASNVASEPGDCNTIPDNIFDVPELFPGGSGEGNVCLTVAESEVASLVLFLEETFSFTGTRVFFALR